jgi:hypothetical protein
MKPAVLSRMMRSGRRFGKNFELTWRYGLNLRPAAAYALSGTAPTGEAARVLRDLNERGIGVSSVDALLASDALYQEMLLDAERRFQIDAEAIAAARAQADSNERGVQKPFMHFLLGQNPRVEASSIYARFALQDPIRQIANSYLGMYCQLCAYNVWYNFVTTSPPTQSQLWHRDPEDRYILKVFVCMSDVGEGSGPFTYAPGTHQKGSAKRLPEYLHKDGMTTRSNDSQMAAVVPQDKWIKGIGKKGTVIFADTRGFHKGGLVRERDRTLYIAEFLSQAAGRGLSTARGN